jgi:hypothetical protein
MSAKLKVISAAFLAIVFSLRLVVEKNTLPIAATSLARTRSPESD